MTKQDITKYIEKFGRLETPNDIVNMINYFCNQAIENYIQATTTVQEKFNDNNVS